MGVTVHRVFSLRKQLRTLVLLGKLKRKQPQISRFIGKIATFKVKVTPIQMENIYLETKKLFLQKGDYYERKQEFIS